MSDSASVEEALTQVENDLGPLAIMVNNAGALAMSHVARVKPLIEQQQAEQAVGPITTPLEALVRLTDDEWRFVMSVHLDGTFYGTRAAVRRMAPRGDGHDRSTWPRSAGSRDAPDTRTTPRPRPACSASPGPRQRK